MNLKSKRKEESDRLKDGRKEKVVIAAVTVFQTLGIDNAKMTDVAKQAEVGVASVYRYFKTKVDLAIEVAILVCQQAMNELYKRYDTSSQLKANGLERVACILKIFIDLYVIHPSFVSFMHDFDAFMVREKVAFTKLSIYEEELSHLQKMLMDAIEQGQQDGSIRKDVDALLFYYTSTHALMSLAQKLLLRGHIIKGDATVSDLDQLALLTRMSLDYLRQ